MFMSPREPTGIEGFLSNRSRLLSSPEKTLSDTYLSNERLEHLPEVIVRDLNTYGVCVLDDFLSDERGKKVLAEVLTLHAEGKFRDGKLMQTPRVDVRDQSHIRGDKITWVGGQEPGCANIGYLINHVDRVVTMANRMQNNGQLGNYRIQGRTKAMVACYPSLGTHYVKHVDNPNKDGRCITATYYINPNWHPSVNGGTLRIFPKNQPVLDIAPQFNRIIFFWSDRRNPHSVEPAHRTRYAITLWYHDAIEREQALRRHQQREERRIPDATSFAVQ